MSLAKTFYLLKDAELRVGELYAMIGLSLSITHPDLAELFHDLAGEEQQHARQVEVLRGYFQHSPDSFLETPQAEAILASFVENVDTVRRSFNQGFGKIQPRDILELALDLERSLVERHQTFIFKVSDPRMGKLLESLSLGSNDHILRLERFKAELPASPGG